MSEAKKLIANEAPETSVPKAVVARLSLYLRELEHLLQLGHETTNSSHLGGVLGFTDAQVRKDLAYFGQFGYPGIGYRTRELISAIRAILGTDQAWRAALIGAGNLGRALMGYKGFQRRGFTIEAVFDVDRAKVGTLIEGLAVQHLDDLPRVVHEKQIRLGLLAIPATVAQPVADLLVSSGIQGILNFAPVTVSTPESVNLVSVDLAIEMEQLSFAVVNRLRSN